MKKIISRKDAKTQREAIRLFSLRSLRLCVTFSLITFAFENCNTQSKNKVTYSDDIAPIIYKHCTTCHRPGSAGSFDLITYDDVKKRAKTIALVTQSRLMPPWPADTSYSHFRDEKVLRDEEIALIKQWVDEDAPLGDSTKLPSPPSFAELSFFAKPDIVLHMHNAFHIEGNNKDHFMMMKIPFELPKDTFIKAIEIIPGNRKLVHHINAHLVVYDEGKKKDYTKGEKYVDAETMDKPVAFEKLDLANDDGKYPLLIPSVTNYLPGVETSFYPEGISGWRVKKQGVLLLDNIHYGPSPVDTTDSTTFNIFFSATPPRRVTSEFIIGTSGITPVEPPLVIQPNTVATFRSHYKLPEDISILTVNPHMHLLGKSFLAFAVLPDGDTIHLIKIPKWDFRWQYFYTFKKMVKIPKGTTIYAEGKYDNTMGNPLNPFNPPQVVAERNGSMRTTDEMFQLIVTYTNYQDGDENISLETLK